MFNFNSGNRWNWTFIDARITFGNVAMSIGVVSIFLILEYTVMESWMSCNHSKSWSILTLLERGQGRRTWYYGSDPWTMASIDGQLHREVTLSLSRTTMRHAAFGLLVFCIFLHRAKCLLRFTLVQCGCISPHCKIVPYKYGWGPGNMTC